MLKLKSDYDKIEHNEEVYNHCIKAIKNHIKNANRAERDLDEGGVCFEEGYLNAYQFLLCIMGHKPDMEYEVVRGCNFIAKFSVDGKILWKNDDIKKIREKYSL